MKNMKKILSMLMVSILLLTPFVTIPSSAEEQLPEFLFGVVGYKFGAAIEDIEIKEYYEGSVWENKGVYESWEAHIEYENGEIATGNIQGNIQYVLAVRVNGLSEKYYDSYQDIFKVVCGGRFSTANDGNGRIFDVYLDEACLTFKYKLEFYAYIEQLVFNIEGFELGADPRDVRVTFEGHEYVSYAAGGLHAPTKDLEEEAPIREGIQYSVQILLEVSNKIETVDDKIDFVLKGLQEDISGEMTSYPVSSSSFFRQRFCYPF